MSELQIDVPRLLQDLERLSRIGGGPDGGVTRLAFSAEDRAGRDFVEGLLAEIGVSCRFDAVGNLLAIRRGREALPPVLTGSHTDTVGSGGRFDGALGVLVGVAVLRALSRESVDTLRPVGVVSFVNEEGVRYMPDMMGSLFVRGDLSIDEIRGAAGTDGSTIGKEIDRHAMSGDADFTGLEVDAFVELHIEQGPVLDAAQEPIAVVEGVQGLRWLRIRFTGASNHAGTTPMRGRRDASLAAARVVTEVHHVTDRMDGLRATCGRLVQEPNLVNVIPRSVELTVDLRHPDADRLDEAERVVRGLAQRAAAADRLQVTVDRLANAPPVRFDARVIDVLDRAAAARGVACRRLVSGAGHDAQIMSVVWPTAMLFVRSHNGISHSPAELTSPDDISVAANVLLRAVVDLAGRQD